MTQKEVTSLVDHMYQNEAMAIINLTETILSLKPTVRTVINGLHIEVHPDHVYVGKLNELENIIKGESRCTESAIFSRHHSPKLMISKYLVHIVPEEYIVKERLMCVINEQINPSKGVE